MDSTETKFLEKAMFHLPAKEQPYQEIRNSFAAENMLPEADRRKPNFVTRIWRNHFTFAYYCCVNPFKFVLDETTNEWRRQTLLIQQLVCFLMWLLYWVRTLTELIMKAAPGFAPTAGPLTASSYFFALNELLRTLCTFLYFVAVLKYQDKIKSYLHHSLNLHVNEASVSCRVQSCCRLYLIFQYSMLCGIYLIFQLFAYIHGRSHSFDAAFSVFVEKGWTRFFSSALAAGSKDNLYCTGNVLIGTLEMVLFVVAFLVDGVVYSTSFGPLSMGFWLAAKDLEKNVAQLSTDFAKGEYFRKVAGLGAIQEKYESLKKFAFAVNSVFSTFMLLWVTTGVVSAMLYLNRIFATRDGSGIAMMLTWVLALTLVLLLSGETYRIVEDFRGLLLDQDNWRSFYISDRETLLRLVRDIDAGPVVGIGQAGLYRLTYGFTVQLLVACSTLFMVSFEMPVVATLAEATG